MKEGEGSEGAALRFLTHHTTFRLSEGRLNLVELRQRRAAMFSWLLGADALGMWEKLLFVSRSVGSEKLMLLLDKQEVLRGTSLSE